MITVYVSFHNRPLDFYFTQSSVNDLAKHLISAQRACIYLVIIEVGALAQRCELMKGLASKVVDSIQNATDYVF